MDDDDWCAPDSHCLHLCDQHYICCFCGWDEDAE